MYTNVFVYIFKASTEISNILFENCKTCLEIYSTSFKAKNLYFTNSTETALKIMGKDSVEISNSIFEKCC